MWTRLRKCRAALTAVLAGMAMSGVANAQTCDVPLVIQRTAGQASVLIIIDTSGSMNEVVYHSAYNPATTYSGRFRTDDTYNVRTDGTYRPRDFGSTSASFARSGSRSILSSRSSQGSRTSSALASAGEVFRSLPISSARARRSDCAYFARTS